MSEGLTEDEIHDRRIIWDVPGVLDDAEDRKPADHWFNTTGTRVYALDRVELAEELLKNQNGEQFFSHRAEEINSSSRPYTPAIFVFDYRTLLAALDRDIKSRIWSERLCHPVAGRRPGSNERELELIKEALVVIARHGFPEDSFASFEDVERHLKTIAATAHKQLAPAWPHVLVRQARLRNKISRGRSQRAARRVLELFSLIQTGRLGHQLISQEPLTLVELLSFSPTIRIDHEVLDASSCPT